MVVVKNPQPIMTVSCKREAAGDEHEEEASVIGVLSEAEATEDSVGEVNIYYFLDPEQILTIV